MDMPATGEGSPHLVEGDVSSISEVKQKVTELAELINRLPNDQKIQQEKTLEQELQQQKTLKTYFQTQCNELLENKLLLEKRVQELEATNLSHRASITSLRDNLVKAEESQQRLPDNYATTLESYKELTLKHNKLREFVKAHLSHLQKLTKSNLAATSQPLNEKLVAMSTKFNKRLEDTENYRQLLQKSASTNSKLVARITRMLENRNQARRRKVAKIQCRVCSSKFPSRKKLHIHRITVHTVQKASKFFNKKYAVKRRLFRRKLILKLAKLKGDSTGTWNVIPSTTASDKSNDKVVNFAALVHNTEMCATTEKLFREPITSLQIQTNTTPATSSVFVTEPNASGKIKAREHYDLATTRVTRSTSISANVTPTNLSKTPTCTLGSRDFVFPGDLQIHEYQVQADINPDTNNRYCCMTCGSFFPTRETLNNHQKSEHNIMSTSTPTKRKLETEENLTNEQNFKRKRPGRKSKNRMFVMDQKHEVDRSKRLGFYCRCGSGHGSSKLLRDHIRYFTRERKFVCQIPNCKLNFAYLSDLRGHMKATHKLKTLLKHLAKGCSNCGESFATRKELFEHRRNKHSEAFSARLKTQQQPSICISTESNAGDCIMEQNPETSSNITNGRTEKTNLPEKINLSPIHSSIITTPIPTVYVETKQHAFSHSEEPDTYFCKCTLGFGSMDTLNAHVRYFALGKNFSCSHCETLFPNLRDSNVHIRKCHRDALPQTRCVGCTLCGVVFADETEHRNHLVSSGNERNKQESWSCPSKKMKSMSTKASTATQEISSSTKTSNVSEDQDVPSSSSSLNDNFELKFVCKHCDKRFLFAYTLRKHMIGVHKIVDNLGVGCQNCGQFFLDHMELLRHNKLVHKPEAQTEVEMKYVPSLTTSQTSKTCQESCSGKLLPVEDSQVHEGIAPPNALENKRRRKKRKARRSGKIFVCKWCPNNTVRYDQYVNLKSHARSCHPLVANQLLKYACRMCIETFNTHEEVSRHRTSAHENTQ